MELSRFPVSRGAHKSHGERSFRTKHAFTTTPVELGKLREAHKDHGESIDHLQSVTTIPVELGKSLFRGSQQEKEVVTLEEERGEKVEFKRLCTFQQSLDIHRHPVVICTLSRQRFMKCESNLCPIYGTWKILQSGLRRFYEEVKNEE